jgi:hypothetical protein
MQKILHSLPYLKSSKFSSLLFILNDRAWNENLEYCPDYVSPKTFARKLINAHAHIENI